MAIQIFALIMLRHSDSAGRLPPGWDFFWGGSPGGVSPVGIISRNRLEE